MGWDVILHVTSICFAWLFCAPLALAAARLRHYDAFKSILTRTLFKGYPQFWYLIHRNLLLSGSIATVFAGSLMLSRVRFHYYYEHKYLGITVMSLATLQACGLAARMTHCVFAISPPIALRSFWASPDLRRRLGAEFPGSGCTGGLVPPRCFWVRSTMLS